MMRPTLFSAVLALVVLATNVSAQDFDKYEYTTTHLGGQVYLLAGAGGNVAVCVGNDGVLLVDDDYAPMGQKLAAAVAAITDKPIRFVVSTHWHFDHVEGNEAMASAGALVIAHDNVRRRMAAGQTIGLLDHTVPPAPLAALPTFCYSDSISLHLGSEDADVLHAPFAHTDGDGVIVFRQANVIHAGDIFFNCGYPFIDISSGGTIDGMIAAVGRILRLCDEKTQVIPGHGPIAHAADLRTYLGMLEEFRSIIAKEVAAGKDLAEIRSERPTAALDEKWGKVFFPPDLFTEMVFRSLPKMN